MVVSISGGFSRILLMSLGFFLVSTRLFLMAFLLFMVSFLIFSNSIFAGFQIFLWFSFPPLLLGFDMVCLDFSILIIGPRSEQTGGRGVQKSDEKISGRLLF